MKPLPTLYVEGKDDQFSIANLLIRHGIDMAEKVRPIRIQIAKDASTGAEGVVPLLAIMANAILASTDRPIGFVLDIDIACEDRWKAVAAQLQAAGIPTPDACPVGGFIGRVPDYPVDVGIWMMPDCTQDHGTLETFLRTLVASDDSLWLHAEESTSHSIQHGAKFSKTHEKKAVVHCWLAWQEEPGVPFGTAINARYFNHDSPEAMAFLAWLKRLFQLA